MNTRKPPPAVSPSLICLDMCNLEHQVRQLEAAGIELLHIDILDGYFSPSMPLGLETVRQLRGKTRLGFDAHLMVEKPDFFIDELLDIGVRQLIFQLETAPHADALLSRIRAAGVRAGVALKPGTPLSSMEYLLERCDTVLLMLINPGYASSKTESQVPYARRKVRELRAMIDRHGLPVNIELDGRISREDIQYYGRDERLADIFVAGSTCLDCTQLEQSAAALNTLCKTTDEG